MSERLPIIKEEDITSAVDYWFNLGDNYNRLKVQFTGEAIIIEKQNDEYEEFIHFITIDYQEMEQDESEWLDVFDLED